MPPNVFWTFVLFFKRTIIPWWWCMAHLSSWPLRWSTMNPLAWRRTCGASESSASSCKSTKQTDLEDETASNPGSAKITRAAMLMLWKLKCRRCTFDDGRLKCKGRFLVAKSSAILWRVLGTTTNLKKTTMSKWQYMQKKKIYFNCVFIFMS